MEKAKAFLICILVVLSVSSCSGQAPAEGQSTVCVATWNVQNLFNAVLDGAEYDEYKPSSGWNESMYKRRLSNAAKVLSCLPEAGEYVIVLNEIEGPYVAEGLLFQQEMRKLGLHWYACTSKEGSPIQSAVVSSLPVTGARIHEVDGELRPVLEVELEAAGEKIFIFAVHFKSNVGGTAQTQEARILAASVVNRIAQTVAMENPGALMLVCGDLNDECWENRTLGRDGEIKVSGTFGRDSWYCFWMDEGLTFWPQGSYFYGGSWKSYDNILVSQSGGDNSGLEFMGAGVVFEGIIRTADSKPFAWNRDLLSGVSDHLPVWILLGGP